MADNQYREDILKNGFEQQTIRLDDDYEGKVIATLIRRQSINKSDKAILYIHGFNDYFFQKEMAYEFNAHNFNFYALDLRKYGRSYLSHQKFNDARDLRDYFEEILLALDIIRREDNNKVIISGHSTGGLILALFAKDFTGKGIFDGLVLNSPFYEFNKSWFVKKLISFISPIGKLFPKIKIPGGFSKEYGENLHRSFSGEWDYNLEWKPNVAPRVSLGWIRAIYIAQQELKNGVNIYEPVMVLHSSDSMKNMSDTKQIRSMDAILNVADIERTARKINGNVTVEAIKGGIHDLILSAEPVRKAVYQTIFNWLNRQGF